MLAVLNLPALQLSWALLQFNVALERGQLVIFEVVVTLLFLLRRSPGYPLWAIGAGCVTAMFLVGL